MWLVLSCTEPKLWAWNRTSLMLKPSFSKLTWAWTKESYMPLTWSNKELTFNCTIITSQKHRTAKSTMRWTCTFFKCKRAVSMTQLLIEQSQWSSPALSKKPNMHIGSTRKNHHRPWLKSQASMIQLKIELLQSLNQIPFRRKNWLFGWFKIKRSKNSLQNHSLTMA